MLVLNNRGLVRLQQQQQPGSEATGGSSSIAAQPVAPAEGGAAGVGAAEPGTVAGAGAGTCPDVSVTLTAAGVAAARQRGIEGVGEQQHLLPVIVLAAGVPGK